ncbi:CLUMA_CG001022, isoform A [Clunio marinus]|uniref:CLUMA_CG001022, isoform A n=1 Tax=Clunio marinus TaxID=568069 RepID=A0A1J1HI41_9DIPT|nr:CLUMA_CG001022, isoform A [Clunio marinus]
MDRTPAEQYYLPWQLHRSVVIVEEKKRNIGKKSAQGKKAEDIMIDTYTYTCYVELSKYEFLMKGFAKDSSLKTSNNGRRRKLFDFGKLENSFDLSFDFSEAFKLKLSVI